MPLRDLVLTLLVSALLLAVFKHPVIGAYLWAWLSLMNPHKMTYSFAFRMPFAQVAALVTMLMCVTTRERQPLPRSPIVMVQVALLLWMSLTCLFALAPQERVLDRWILVMKIHVMLWVTWMLVTEAKQLRVLIGVVTMSVAFFGIKGGIWTVLTGGGGRVWGPPGGMLEGNNELAVALVMLLPMLYYLRQTEARAWLRRLLIAFMVLVAFSVLGSQSRGALLALLSMTFFLGLKSKHPFRSSVALLAVAMVVIGFMPDTWTERMDTIRAYEADGSAMSRIWTWHTLWNAAVDRPLIGAGFAADTHAVFSRYAPDGPEWASFRGRILVAHSIYFQMLGEHGFVGLTLFLGLGLTAWVAAGKVARKAKDDPEYGDWMPLLMRMVQVSLIGYAVGGAFLSLAYVDLPYYIIGFVVTSDGLLRRRSQQPVPPAAAGAVRVLPALSARPPAGVAGSAAKGEGR
jgi:probable O-glycosylation ligase (exosortase A-associated)